MTNQNLSYFDRVKFDLVAYVQYEECNKGWLSPRWSPYQNTRTHRPLIDKFVRVDSTQTIRKLWVSVKQCGGTSLPLPTDKCCPSWWHVMPSILHRSYCFALSQNPCHPLNTQTCSSPAQSMPCTYRQQVPPKRRRVSSTLHSVTTQNTSQHLCCYTVRLRIPVTNDATVLVESPIWSTEEINEKSYDDWLAVFGLEISWDVSKNPPFSK